MDMLMALAVSIGVLIAVWVKVGAMASLAVPAGIDAWACFFAAGGKTTGLQKTIASTLSGVVWVWLAMTLIGAMNMRSEEHTSELQSLAYLVCRLLLEKKKKKTS